MLKLRDFTQARCKPFLKPFSLVAGLLIKSKTLLVREAFAHLAKDFWDFYINAVNNNNNNKN